MWAQQGEVSNVRSAWGQQCEVGNVRSAQCEVSLGSAIFLPGFVDTSCLLLFVVFRDVGPPRVSRSASEEDVEAFVASGGRPEASEGLGGASRGFQERPQGVDTELAGVG